MMIVAATRLVRELHDGGGAGRGVGAVGVTKGGRRGCAEEVEGEVRVRTGNEMEEVDISHMTTVASLARGPRVGFRGKAKCRRSAGTMMGHPENENDGLPMRIINMMKKVLQNKQDKRQM